MFLSPNANCYPFFFLQDTEFLIFLIVTFLKVWVAMAIMWVTRSLVLNIFSYNHINRLHYKVKCYLVSVEYCNHSFRCYCVMKWTEWSGKTHKVMEVAAKKIPHQLQSSKLWLCGSSNQTVIDDELTINSSVLLWMSWNVLVLDKFTVELYCHYFMIKFWKPLLVMQ